MWQCYEFDLSHDLKQQELSNGKFMYAVFPYDKFKYLDIFQAQK